MIAIVQDRFKAALKTNVATVLEHVDVGHHFSVRPEYAPRYHRMQRSKGPQQGHHGRHIRKFYGHWIIIKLSLEGEGDLQCYVHAPLINRSEISL